MKGFDIKEINRFNNTYKLHNLTVIRRYRAHAKVIIIQRNGVVAIVYCARKYTKNRKEYIKDVITTMIFKRSMNYTENDSEKGYKYISKMIEADWVHEAEELDCILNFHIGKAIAILTSPTINMDKLDSYLNKYENLENLEEPKRESYKIQMNDLRHNEQMSYHFIEESIIKCKN